MSSDNYIYKKEVDWSVLNYGINIPIDLQSIFYKSINFYMNKGESKKIKIFIENNECIGVLTNINFDKTKYPIHKDLLQIRYTPNSPIAIKLREIFFSSYDYLFAEKEKLENKRKQINLPNDLIEYIAIYSTCHDDTFVFECVTNEELVLAKKVVNVYEEFQLENILYAQDFTSAFIEKEKIAKIRKLDKTIGDSLKLIYNYKCQICGEYIGEKYNAQVIHTHHIEPFSKSLNNNPENLLIVCPNHHGVIHTANPIFERKKKLFLYPNGYKEGLKLNAHL